VEAVVMNQKEFLTDLKVLLLNHGINHLDLDCAIDGTTGFLEFRLDNGLIFQFDSDEISEFWPD